jgi:biopolymer transport protein ExbD
MPLKTQVEEIPALNLTSMIDVLFLLIIFFMAGTKFTELERDIDLQVPRVANNPPLTSAPSKRVVNVCRDGRILLDRQVVSLEELTRRLSSDRAQYSSLGVIIRGDADGAFQHVADALNACHKAGIAELAISVRLESQLR